MAADDFCYLTTTGRVSGRPHAIEIWYAQRDHTLYLLAGGGRRSDWVLNLAADAGCSVRFGAESDPVHANGRLLDHEGAEPGEVATARRLVFEKYQARYSGDLSDWRERALPVAVDLRP